VVLEKEVRKRKFAKWYLYSINGRGKENGTPVHVKRPGTRVEEGSNNRKERNSALTLDERKKERIRVKGARLSYKKREMKMETSK